MRQEGRVTDAVPQIQGRRHRCHQARDQSVCTRRCFEVIKQLPVSSELEYRIKSANEPNERVARESELIKAPA
jgi:hypothetical protein